MVEWQPPYFVFKACFGASLECNPGQQLSDAGIVDTSIDHIQPIRLGRPPVMALDASGELDQLLSIL